MVTSTDFYQKYGHPGDKEFQKKYLTIWDVPTELEIGIIPKRIYCNKDLIDPLKNAFTNLIEMERVKELITWDGCYNFRPIRGYEKKYEAALKTNKALSITYLSIHSWGCAVDVNAAWNGLGKEPQLSEDFVWCFERAGFDWGGRWKRKDGMHFQLAKI